MADTTSASTTAAPSQETVAVPDSRKEALITQVEFYLSDSNLPFDKFLFQLWSDSFTWPHKTISDTPVPDDYKNPAGLIEHPESKYHRFHTGWIPLEKLSTFKRMREFTEPAPKGFGSVAGIAEALKSSTLVETHEFGTEEEGGGWYVRRLTELKRPADVLDRSIYVKGFPVTDAVDESEDARKALRETEHELQQRIEAWARELKVGKVLSVRMRREDKEIKGRVMKNAGKFKGSVFVEFQDVESVEKFMALDPKPTFEGQELEIMSKSHYVDVKREKYAPGTSKPAAPSIPRAPGQPQKGVKPYNAWALRLIGENGFPVPIKPEDSKNGREDKKRKAEDGSEEREILFDGVRFTARRSGRNDSSIEIVDEANVGTGEGQWVPGKLLKFTVAKKDGAFTGPKEQGGNFNFMELKQKLAPIVKPGFIGLAQSERPIAGLPASTMAVDSKPSEFPTKLTAPPTIGSASDAAKPAEAPASTESGRGGAVEYPAPGQASFKENVTDEIFEKIKSEFSEFEGRKIEWTRATPEAERAHILSRARWHAKEAFSDHRGEKGGRGGRGGARGGRGRGRGGQFKRQRRD